jgi:hypothetical protein
MLFRRVFTTQRSTKEFPGWIVKDFPAPCPWEPPYAHTVLPSVVPMDFQLPAYSRNPVEVCWVTEGFVVQNWVFRAPYSDLSSAIAPGPMQVWEKIYWEPGRGLSSASKA